MSSTERAESVDPTAALLEALHSYLDGGGDPDTMLDMARMVAKERGDPEDEADRESYRGSGPLGF